MKQQLKSFEDYVSSLTRLGVFPSFHRGQNGWSCVLRNGLNKQLMPFNAGEECRAGTMLDSLIVAVESMNLCFSNPKDLHIYINTGTDQLIESLLQSVDSLNETKPQISNNVQ